MADPQFGGSRHAQFGVPSGGAGTEIAAYFTASTAGVEAGLDRMQGSFGKTQRVIAGFIGAVSFVKLIQGITELTAETIKFERIAAGYEALTARFHISSEQLVKDVQRIMQSQVAAVHIMESVNKALTLLPPSAERMTELAIIATGAAAALGLDVRRAFDDITTGIGRASPKILDNLGIIVNAREAYRGYAAEIGKSVNMLGAVDKQIALLNQVIDRNIGRFGEIAKAVAPDPFQQVAAAVVDLRIKLGKMFTGTARSILSFIASLIDSEEKMQAWVKGARDILDAVVAIGIALITIRTATSAYIAVIGGLTAAQTGLSAALGAQTITLAALRQENWKVLNVSYLFTRSVAKQVAASGKSEYAILGEIAANKKWKEGARDAVILRHQMRTEMSNSVAAARRVLFITTLQIAAFVALAAFIWNVIKQWQKYNDVLEEVRRRSTRAQREMEGFTGLASKTLRNLNEAYVAVSKSGVVVTGVTAEMHEELEAARTATQTAANAVEGLKQALDLTEDEVLDFNKVLRDLHDGYIDVSEAGSEYSRTQIELEGKINSAKYALNMMLSALRDQLEEIRVAGAGYEDLSDDVINAEKDFRTLEREFNALIGAFARGDMTDTAFYTSLGLLTKALGDARDTMRELSYELGRLQLMELFELPGAGKGWYATLWESFTGIGGPQWTVGMERVEATLEDSVETLERLEATRARIEAGGLERFIMDTEVLSRDIEDLTNRVGDLRAERRRLMEAGEAEFDPGGVMLRNYQARFEELGRLFLLQPWGEAAEEAGKKAEEALGGALEAAASDYAKFRAMIETISRRLELGLISPWEAQREKLQEHLDFYLSSYETYRQMILEKGVEVAEAYRSTLIGMFELTEGELEPAIRDIVGRLEEMESAFKDAADEFERILDTLAYKYDLMVAAGGGGLEAELVILDKERAATLDRILELRQGISDQTYNEKEALAEIVELEARILEILRERTIKEAEIATQVRDRRMAAREEWKLADLALKVAREQARIEKMRKVKELYAEEARRLAEQLDRIQEVWATFGESMTESILEQNWQAVGDKIGKIMGDTIGDWVSERIRAQMAGVMGARLGGLGGGILGAGVGYAVGQLFGGGGKEKALELAEPLEVIVMNPITLRTPPSTRALLGSSGTIFSSRMIDLIQRGGFG